MYVYVCKTGLRLEHYYKFYIEKHKKDGGVFIKCDENMCRIVYVSVCTFD